MGDKAAQTKTQVNRYVPIVKVRRDTKKLVKHYGDIRKTSQATKIPYRTLQGILLEGKLTQVTRTTADKISQAAKNPPEIVVSYADKRYVEVERVQPLVIYLEQVYGNLARAAAATDIPEGSLRNVRRALNKGVDKKLAERIVEVVLAHRRPFRSIIDTYEEDDYTPRYAIPAETDNRIRVKQIVEEERAKYGKDTKRNAS